MKRRPKRKFIVKRYREVQDLWRLSKSSRRKLVTVTPGNKIELEVLSPAKAIIEATMKETNLILLANSFPV